MMNSKTSLPGSKVAPKKKKKAPAAKDPEGCYFFPGCTEKTYQNVPRFKYPKQPEFTQPSQLCLYHLDWQPTQFYYICAYCAIFHREDEVKFAKMPVDGKELKKLKDRKNKKKGAGGKKGKKSAKSAAPKKGKGKKGGGKGEDGEEVEKPKEDPIKNEIQVAICRNCLPKGCETVYPALDQPKADEQGG
ncbi:uncharacterized protein LOC134847626 isoform X2 [Symsagittifera roscoffensis]|uniref:uncharacterized protein LOC134847626 isoform X2 n=1 Tax=Symsagittifera roscoffensis TaxID=84072 RepID=UPI00307BD9D0